MRTALLVVIAVLLGVGYWYYTDSQAKIMALQDENIKLNVAVQQQKQAIDKLQKHAEEQAAQVQELQTGLNAANSDKAKLEKTLREHDLAALARENPKIIEDKMNKATARVWRDLEATTGATPRPEPTQPSSAAAPAKPGKKSTFKKLENANAPVQ